jgi:hypothetical protein
MGALWAIRPTASMRAVRHGRLRQHQESGARISFVVTNDQGQV